MIPPSWRGKEIAVVGLAKSGRAAARLLRQQGMEVYASDAADSAELRATAGALVDLGCAVDLGRHDVERIRRSAAVVVSPGVPPTVPPLEAACAAGVPVLSELDLGARLLSKTRIIVVTGTNGKTTTTALAAHLLKATGLSDADAAGNIGRPLSEVAMQPPHPEWLAVEASSFQLHDCPSLEPAVGVLTNLAPDHLDRYPTVEAYYADKQLLYRNASERSRWVSNGDDERAMAMAASAAGVHEAFSLANHRAQGYYDRAAGWMVLRGVPLLRRREFALLGDHNVENALAAALALPGEADRDRLAAGLASFRPLPHRLEPVRDVGGVLWINDSKATNVASTLVALRSMDRPAVLLLGGRHKGEPYTALRPLLARARGVIVYGEAALIAERDLAGTAALERGGDLADVIARARGMARPGDAVLLSPACSSYDMFENYEDRGRQFRVIVEGL